MAAKNSAPHRYNTWGRTRSPKNLAGTQGGKITVLANTDTLQGITASTAGYATENQRYLHVLVEETNAGSDTNATTVAVYGYCHAFLRWFAIPQAFEGYGTNANPTGATIDPANVATLPAVHAPEAGGRQYRTYQILGVDRVAFVSATTSTVNVLAACSTF